MDKAVKARFALIAAAILFSTGGAAIKACGLSAWQVASFRSGIAALTILLLLPAARRNWNAKTLLVSLAYAATLILFVLANKLTTSANSIFLQDTAPFYILLLAPFLLKEPIRSADLIFMGAVLLGLGMFFIDVENPTDIAPQPLLGNWLAAISGITWAFTVLGLRWLGKAESSAANPALSATAIGNVLAFLVCLPLALPMTQHSVNDWLVLAYLGIFQIGLAYIFVATGIVHVPALEASILLLIEPVLNPIWSWLVHGEAPGYWALVGGIVILSATLLKTWWSAKGKYKHERKKLEHNISQPTG